MQRDTQPEQPAPEISGDAVLDVYVLRGNLITLDTLTVSEQQLVEEVEKALAMVKEHADNRLHVHITARGDARYVYYRKVLQLLLNISARERDRISMQRWSKASDLLSLQETRELDGLSPILIYEYK